MKNVSKIGLIVAIISIWGIRNYVVFGQATASFSSLSGIEKIVAERETQRFAAQVSQDFGILENVLADDLVYVHSSGLVDTKASFIKSIKDGKLKYLQMTAEEMKVRVYGKTAIITGTCAAKLLSNAQELNLRFRYTDMYVKRKGNWQLVSWQSLRLP